MMKDLEQKAYLWVQSEVPPPIEDENYCQTRDVFQARLEQFIRLFSTSPKIKEQEVYLLSSVIGEIGNNSFDHNLGNWSDIPGIFFGHEWHDNILTIVLADRGLGIRATLKRVKPDLQSDEEALEVAFNERISGRAPEPRGNGLKFVKESIRKSGTHLSFLSGTAKAEFNATMSIHPSEHIHGCLAVLIYTSNL